MTSSAPGAGGAPAHLCCRVYSVVHQDIQGSFTWSETAIKVHERNDIRVKRRTDTSDDAVLAGLLSRSIVEGKKRQTLARAPLDVLLRLEDKTWTHTRVLRNPIGLYCQRAVWCVGVVCNGGKSVLVGHGLKVHWNTIDVEVIPHQPANPQGMFRAGCFKLSHWFPAHQNTSILCQVSAFRNVPVKRSCQDAWRVCSPKTLNLKHLWISESAERLKTVCVESICGESEERIPVS